jgi:uncharacterized protein YcaQ
MSSPPLLSISDARKMFLHSQGLYGHEWGRKKEGTLAAIVHLGYVQIDTISVVERAHHHTIFTRIRDYQKKYLDELMQEKLIFEYWSHAAAYLPMSGYRFSLPRKKLFADGKQHWFKDKKPTQYVYDRIKAEGPLQSKDFEEKKAVTGWWEWKTTKQALEQLFMEGRLMIAERKNFQKVYDLTERVLPASVNTKMPTEKEMAEHLILSAICANGIVAQHEIAYLRKGHKELVQKALKHLIKEGTITEIKIGDIKELYYTTDDKLADLNNIKASKKIHILSPFDNAVIQRKRLQTLFDYDYTIECYVPAPRRVHGYFCLPILYGDNFVGRMDCKADRTTENFIIQNLWLEAGFKPNEIFMKAFVRSVNEFAFFNNCDYIVLEKSNLDRVTQKVLKGLLV